jgi:hypothetical protein
MSRKVFSLFAFVGFVALAGLGLAQAQTLAATPYAEATAPSASAVRP